MGRTLHTLIEADIMNCKIYSGFTGKTYTFSIPGSSYIYTDLGDPEGASGTLGAQICQGGRLTGSTLSYSGDSEEEFEKICKRWWREHVKYYSEDHVFDV